MRACPMWIWSYTVMPHTYIRTSLSTSGWNGCLRPVSESWMASMGLQAPARLLGGDELQQRGELGTVRAPRERDPQRHVERSALASGARAEIRGEALQVGPDAGDGLGRGREESPARLLDQTLLLGPERRRLAVHHPRPQGEIRRQREIVAHQLQELRRLARVEPARHLRGAQALDGLTLPVQE